MPHASTDPTHSTSINHVVPTGLIRPGESPSASSPARVRLRVHAGAVLLAALAGMPACGPVPGADGPPPPPAKTAATPPPARATEPPKLTFTPEADAAAKIAADIKYLASEELAGRGTG